VISINAPFVSFDKKTRILKTDKEHIFLHKDKGEQSKVPNLNERTKNMLKTL
jgi:hypothetical protein